MKNVLVLLPEYDSFGTYLGSLTVDITNNPTQYTHNINENLCKDGRRIWISWLNTVIKNEDGKIREILSIGSDITHEKTGKQLRKNEKRLRAFIDASSDAVFVIDPAFTQVRILYDRGEFHLEHMPVGNGYNRHIPLEDQPRIQEAINKAITTRTNCEIEHGVIRPDGTQGWLVSRVVPVFDDAGHQRCGV